MHPLYIISGWQIALEKFRMNDNDSEPKSVVMRDKSVLLDHKTSNLPVIRAKTKKKIINPAEIFT
jgi:hypothetical protein